MSSPWPNQPDQQTSTTPVVGSSDNLTNPKQPVVDTPHPSARGTQRASFSFSSNDADNRWANDASGSDSAGPTPAEIAAAFPFLPSAENLDVNDSIDVTPNTANSTDTIQQTVRRSPPWLISCILHMLSIILLGLIPYVIANAEPEIELIVTRYNEDMADEPDLDALVDIDMNDLSQEIATTPEELLDVQQPKMDFERIEFVPETIRSKMEVKAPRMNMLLNGREEGMKQGLVAAYGGSEKTENAVGAGLKWLASRQDSDGLWSLSGKYRENARTRAATYSSGAGLENKCAATGLALLAFQGAGYTHENGKNEKFRRTVRRGWEGLLKRQNRDGSFTKANPRRYDHLREHHLNYTQGICGFALCEFYAMTQDARYREPAERIVQYLVDNQSATGGWRYKSGTGSDLSVTGWVMMALQSARMAGISVPPETFYKVEEFLNTVQRDEGSTYAYRNSPNQEPTMAMTAEGLLCRQYLGWLRESPAMQEGAQLLVDRPVDYKLANVYYWYYATQVLHNIEGDLWRQWNQVLSNQVPKRQERRGRERGSWSPSGDAWGSHGGRLYTTCLSVYMLEVYYRHLPIYSQDFGLSLKDLDRMDDLNRSK